MVTFVGNAFSHRSEFAHSLPLPIPLDTYNSGDRNILVHSVIGTDPRVYCINMRVTKNTTTRSWPQLTSAYWDKQIVEAHESLLGSVGRDDKDLRGRVPWRVRMLNDERLDRDLHTAT